jgi:EAL domain-containing protein (putative c-di-GMP-specific phosphodiesterase class I)
MVAVEALARWDHPEKGQLGAGMFAPLAEEMGLGRELARTVLEQAINQSVLWWNRFPGLDIRVDVNVSESYLKDSALAFELIHMLESRSGEHLPIWLDISVGGLTGRSWERSEAQLRALSEYGIGLNLDNLGEDGAGLSVLTKFSFDQVKFAKSMIELVDTSEVARQVILSTTDLIRGLGTSVCAIGVENAEQLNFLKDTGIDSVAGYQLARPISAEGLDMVFSLSGNKPPDQTD